MSRDSAERRQRTAETARAQELLSGTAMSAFRVNGAVLAVAEDLARPAGLTAARWKVLGVALEEPATASGIARALGISRQAVQRTADALAVQGLAEYRPNPAHARARLLAPTDEGRAAVRRIDPAHARLAERLVREVGAEALEAAVAGQRLLSAALERIGPASGGAAAGPAG